MILAFHRVVVTSKAKCLINTWKKMSIFVQTFHPITGKNEWIMQSEDYDFHQEIARSAYADMLHDTERNKLYYKAIQKAVASVQRSGKKVNVLDIGTGTGLLSMMAARCGADKVTACEVFKPMANCAEKIIKENGYSDIIRVVQKRSTEMTVGQGCDMEEKANVLVAEVFDTELIGEGAIETYSHALQHLMEDSCIVVPSSATIYAQVVESEKCTQWNQLLPVDINETVSIRVPENIVKCSGAAAVHDIQLTELPEEDFEVITKPCAIFEFDFTGSSKIEFGQQKTLKLTAEKTGTCQVVFMWWDLKMDMDGEIILSCAPKWAHPTPKDMQWRDHWMQALYYPSSQIDVVAGETFTLEAFHDQYSLWFNVSKSSDVKLDLTPPVCRCKFHVMNSRTRVGMINDATRNRKYAKLLNKIISQQSIVLYIGDLSLLPVMAAKLGAKHVYCLDSNRGFKSPFQSFIEDNSVSDRVSVLSELTIKSLNNSMIDVIIGEPFFQTSLLPWDHLQFWYRRSDLDKSCLSDNVKIFPSRMSVWGIGVEYNDLCKIHSPVTELEEFDVSAFNKLITHSSSICDDNVEPQPLWEYPSKAVTLPFELLTVDMRNSVNITENYLGNGHSDIVRSGRCNGVALWAEFSFDEEISISTGPISNPIIGEYIKWDRYSRQGVYFIESEQNNNHKTSFGAQRLSYDVKFDYINGKTDFKFFINE